MRFRGKKVKPAVVRVVCCADEEVAVAVAASVEEEGGNQEGSGTSSLQALLGMELCTCTTRTSVIFNTMSHTLHAPIHSSCGKINN